MGKRGSKPSHRVLVRWSPWFAYAIGLITTDGNLSPDGRHIVFISKDREQVERFRVCLGVKNTIGRKSSGSISVKRYYVIQIGDVAFYQFLVGIGLRPNKTKTLSQLMVPEKYFFDFLRGHFDGDGSFYSYRDKRWRSSFMFYTAFVSASKRHIEWLRRKIGDFAGVRGHVTRARGVYQLKFAKQESMVVLKRMYSGSSGLFLRRKYDKISTVLSSLGSVARGW